MAHLTPPSHDLSPVAEEVRHTLTGQATLVLGGGDRLPHQIELVLPYLPDAKHVAELKVRWFVLLGWRPSLVGWRPFRRMHGLD